MSHLDQEFVTIYAIKIIPSIPDSPLFQAPRQKNVIKRHAHGDASPVRKTYATQLSISQHPNFSYLQ